MWGVYRYYSQRAWIIFALCCIGVFLQTSFWQSSQTKNFPDPLVQTYVDSHKVHADTDMEQADSDREHSDSDREQADNHKKPVESDRKESPFEHSVLPPCGEICSYNGEVVNNGGWYPQLRKQVNCDNVLKRMAFRHDVSDEARPTENMTDAQRDAFTMSGAIPIQMKFRIAQMDNHAVTFTKQYIEGAILRVQQREPVNSYNDGNCVQDEIEKFKKEIDGSRSLVIGTIGPWLEAILLAYGAKNVTTSEYRSIIVEPSNMETFTPYALAESFLKKELIPFEFGSSFSSIEHAGLGRYSDPVNPYGDLEAMAQVWCMMKPGGLFVLGIPGRDNENADLLMWNAHRAYGMQRLPHLTANWEVVDKTYCSNAHVIIILRKPE